MSQVEASSREPCGSCAPPHHLDIFQSSIGHKAFRHRNRLTVSFDTDHASCRADALRKKVQHSLRPTTEINRPTAGGKANAVKQPTRLRPKLCSLPSEPQFFGFAVTQQVRLGLQP